MFLGNSCRNFLSHSLSARETEPLCALASASHLELLPLFTINCCACSFQLQMSYVFLTKKNKNPHTKFEIQRKPKGPPLGAVSLKETLKKKKKKGNCLPYLCLGNTHYVKWETIHSISLMASVRVLQRDCIKHVCFIFLVSEKFVTKTRAGKQL